jgi:hypothetical protein
MSGLLAGKVWHSDLPADLKPLAATLADIGDDDGTSIFPSIAFIAWRLSRSRSAVDEGLRKLREIGVLEVVKQGGGWHTTTEYRLVEEKLPKRLPWKTPVYRVAVEKREKPPCLHEEPPGLGRRDTRPTGYNPSLPVNKSITPASNQRAISLSEHKRRIEGRNNRIADEINMRQEAHVGAAPDSPPFRYPDSLRSLPVQLQAEICRLAESKRLAR